MDIFYHNRVDEYTRRPGWVHVGESRGSMTQTNLNRQSYQVDDLIITLNKEGARDFSKVSFPIRYGRFSEIQTPHDIFQFNLNGEIKFIQGRTQDWPHPGEWLKRTVGNDWIYYSAGDYQGIYEIMGEYYLPCLSYPSNALMDEHPFEKDAVRSAIYAWQSLQEQIERLRLREWPQTLEDFFDRVCENGAETLRQSSQAFHDFIGGEMTVLPPDARHVDYEVIPIVIADGCLYDCGFCRVKSGKGFALRTSGNIMDQLRNLKGFYDQDIRNYNSIFLGQHDALHAGKEIIEFTAKKAYETFEFEHSYLKNGRLFLFGSIDSFISADDRLFQSLSDLPFHTYINVGLESADLSTLATLKKPIAAEKVHEAFRKMTGVNKKYETVEVTANFVYGADLPESHWSSFLELIRKKIDVLSKKGTLYLSPLIAGEEREKKDKRELLRRFYKIKAQSPLPTYLYLIQRL